jgi:peptidoglycan hydrolase-like protein with peptidoglycan-binding domain
MQALAIETLPRLAQGSRNESVKYLQRLLNAYSEKIENPGNAYPILDVDGIFGLQTRNTVESFQAEYREVRNLPTNPRDPNYFPVDGIVGTLTWRALGDFAYRQCNITHNI